MMQEKGKWREMYIDYSLAITNLYDDHSKTIRSVYIP